MFAETETSEDTLAFFSDTEITSDLEYDHFELKNSAGEVVIELQQL